MDILNGIYTALRARKWLVLLSAYIPLSAYATDDHGHHDHYKKPPQVIVVEKNDHAVVGALIGAGITYFLIQRHKKRQQRPLVIIPPAERSAECSATVERVLEVCGISK